MPRDLGVPLRGEPGEWNAITDVARSEVGYETLISGDGPLEVGRGPVRTGVTAVLPLGRAAVGRSCPAGWYSLNGNGEMTGTAWLDETGALSLPVGITNTHAVGPVHRGIIDWSIRRRPVPGGPLAPAGRGRDLGRLPERHQRRARDGADRDRARSTTPAAGRSPRARSAAAPG